MDKIINRVKTEQESSEQQAAKSKIALITNQQKLLLIRVQKLRHILKKRSSLKQKFLKFRLGIIFDMAYYAALTPEEQEKTFYRYKDIRQLILAFVLECLCLPAGWWLSSSDIPFASFCLLTMYALSGFLALWLYLFAKQCRRLISGICCIMFVLINLYWLPQPAKLGQDIILTSICISALTAAIFMLSEYTQFQSFSDKIQKEVTKLEKNAGTIY